MKLHVRQAGKWVDRYRSAHSPHTGDNVQIMDGRYFEQLRVAAEHMQREHERLIAAGWQWDGMDGYSTDRPELWDAEQ